jgi:hypothetical protein
MCFFNQQRVCEGLADLLQSRSKIRRKISPGLNFDFSTSLIGTLIYNYSINCYSLSNHYLKYILFDNYYYTGCLKIREFRIQSVVGEDPVELEE